MTRVADDGAAATAALDVCMAIRPLALALLCLPLTAQVPAALTASEHTAHFEIRWRPGSRAEASVDRIAAAVEGDLKLILGELGITDFKHKITLCLYDDVPELQQLTGVQSGGHSTTLQSHVPHDNDQTRVHELVHVVAEKFSEHGPEPRNLFFAEGLANAVLRFVHGVHVDAVAAFYLQSKRLPAMAEIQGATDFYAWLAQHPGFDGYDVAGSWMRWLLDTFGAAKVRQYYKGVGTQQAFGKDLAALEKGWHEHLAKVQLRPGLRALLEERDHGGNRGATGLDDTIRLPESAWHAFGPKSTTGSEGAWEKSGDADALVLSGKKTNGDWCFVSLGDDVTDGIARCTMEPQAGCFGVQIQFGKRCQAMILRGQGTFVYDDARPVAFDGKTQLGDKPVQIVLRRRGNKASVWIDDRLVVEGDVDGAAAPVGVGCVGGKARFLAIALRQP
jgi:hypothetical protein